MVKTDFASGKVIKMFMENNLPGGIPLINFGTVDVRDVAQAHINCIESDEAQGHRHILVNRSLWMREIGEILRGQFPRYPIPSSEAKYCFIKFAAWFRSDAAKVAQYWGMERTFDNTRSRNVLGIEYRDMNSTIKEMVESMINHGLIAQRQ